jgi:Icc-related predicted phosphoesterase
MKILVISDLHSDFTLAIKACEEVHPDLLLCCGDWGDEEQVAEVDLSRFLQYCTVLSTFGNHDSLDLLARKKNLDGSAMLLGQGETRTYQGLTIAAIGGIWAKSHRLPHYITDSDVARFADQIVSAGPTDILLTHGCPIGLADLTDSGRHGGQKCFLEAFKTIRPRIHFCGHLHIPQEKTLRDGSKVINVGATPQGSVAVVDHDAQAQTLASRLTSVTSGQALP